MNRVRDRLRGWYPPTEAEYATLWRSGLIVLDASVLLNLYRYTEHVRAEMFRTLDHFAARIWVPYQAALEYQRNRLDVRSQQRAAYERVRGELNQAVDRVKGALGGFARHPRLNIDSIRGEFDDALERALSYLERVEQEDARWTEPAAHEDPIRDQLTDLLDGRVGPAPTDHEAAVLRKSAEARFARGNPPGYRDKHKDEERKYGDVFVWEQLLSHAAAEAVGVILVTDDRKDDWWWTERGRTVGPRPELIDEFHRRTDGQLFHMYSPDQFLIMAGKHLDRVVEQQVVDEVQAVAEQVARHRLARWSRQRNELLIEVEREMEFLRTATPRELRELVANEMRSARNKRIEDARWRLRRLDEEVAALRPDSSATDRSFLESQRVKADRAHAELLAKPTQAPTSEEIEGYRRARLLELRERRWMIERDLDTSLDDEPDGAGNDVDDQEVL